MRQQMNAQMSVSRSDVDGSLVKYSLFLDNDARLRMMMTVRRGDNKETVFRCLMGAVLRVSRLERWSSDYFTTPAWVSVFDDSVRQHQRYRPRSHTPAQTLTLYHVDKYWPRSGTCRRKPGILIVASGYF